MDYDSIKLFIDTFSLVVLAIGVIIAIIKISHQYEWYRRDKAISYSTLNYPDLQEFKIEIKEKFSHPTHRDVIPYEEIAEKIKNERGLEVKLNTLLNYYENISIACKNKIADEDILFEMLAGSLVADYKKFAEYITKRRIELNNKKLYLHFQNLANEWDKKLIQPVPEKRALGLPFFVKR